MTIAELQELQRLLEKAQAHAEQQAAYMPSYVTNVRWAIFADDCNEFGNQVQNIIDMTSEALHYEP